MHRVFVLVLGAALFNAVHARAGGSHPEPRVIVNVLSVEGPHEPDRVQRAAREAWGKIIRCYKSSAQGERGVVTMELAIAAEGRVTRVRQTRSSLSNQRLAGCLTRVMEGLPMPNARAASTASVSIRVAPGDAVQAPGRP